jgi:uncharacterized membrane protein YedE/YeeE
MNSAFRDIIVLKEYTLLKAVALALLVEMIGFHLMDALNIITLNPKPLFWAGNIVGGLLFGIGMAFAAGCASGTTYRVGEGMMGSFMALLGLAIGGYTTAKGVISGFVNNPDFGLRTEQFKIAADDGSSLTLGNILGTELAPVFTWGIVIIIAVIGIVLLVWQGFLPWKKEGNQLDFSSLIEKIFKESGWKWWATGTAIGLIGCVAFISNAAAAEIGQGANYPLGITGGWNGLLGYLISGADTALNWFVFLVIGAVIGAFLGAIIAGEFKLRTPKDGKILLSQFAGGFVMGIGAILAAGCNIGNTLSGVPQLSIGSIITTIFIILGTWLTSYFLFMRE